MPSEQDILSVDLTKRAGVRVYFRTRSEHRPFLPWLLSASEEDLPGLADVVYLQGEGALRYVLLFDSWWSYRRAKQMVFSRKIPHFAFPSPAKQYLAWEHQTLFSGMRFADLRRMQLDLETSGLDPNAPQSRILLIALSDTDGLERVLQGSEQEMFAILNALIQDRDPDVIEGHNLFDFDLAFLVARARTHGIKLCWGRDGSDVYAPGSQRPYTIRGQTRMYSPCYVHGRHFVDTLIQIQRFDVPGHLKSYGLKEVVRTLRLEREGRVFVDRTDIPRLFETDRDRLIEYALDDVRDVRTLSDLILPGEFHQTQLVPDSFQSACLSGSGAKINTLMISAYVRRRKAVPVPQAPRAFPGGYTALRRSGIFSQVIKADAESLYPSIMLSQKVKPASDTEVVFLPMLGRLTRRRLEAKAQLKNASSTESAYWDGLQQGLKILINSFYGYLGYARANFNDFDAAERVTTVGQTIAKSMEQLIEATGGQVIEVDTDGVYFTAPDGVITREDEEVLIRRISDQLPEGINLAHDGSYRGMLSLKAKNYVLLEPDGELILRGSALRSRREEPILSEFIAKAARLLVEGNREGASDLYKALQSDILHRRVPPAQFCRTETISERTFQNPRLKNLARAAEGRKSGDRIQVYRREDGTRARLDEYVQDEDTMHLLRRLYKAAQRFQPLFEDEEFVSLFPPPTKEMGSGISQLPLC